MISSVCRYCVTSFGFIWVMVRRWEAYSLFIYSLDQKAYDHV
jgi:hypothetical protein